MIYVKNQLAHCKVFVKVFLYKISVMLNLFQHLIWKQKNIVNIL